MSDIDALLDGFDEPVEIDETANPFAGVHPIPDGTYAATLALGEPDAEKKTTDDGRSYISINLRAHITDPGNPADRRVVFDRVSSLINKKRTSRLAGAVKAAGGSLGGVTTVQDLVRAALDVFNGQPVVKITTRQEAYCKSCGKTTLRGQSRFKDGEGECPKCGDPLSAKVAIVEYASA